MHSNLAPILASQHLADLHEQAARYRNQRSDQQPVRRPRRRYLSRLHLATRAVDRPRTA
jgi:hypothetical protein